MVEEYPYQGRRYSKTYRFIKYNRIARKFCSFGLFGYLKKKHDICFIPGTSIYIDRINIFNSFSYNYTYHGKGIFHWY